MARRRMNRGCNRAHAIGACFWDLWRYNDSLRSRFERAQRVEKLMLLHPMSPFIAIYLRTVYRTYVEGFMPETVVMCRALLERSAKRACAALEIAFVDSKSDTLHSRLELLKRHKWLSAELMRDAHDVRNRGNVSVHEDPTMVRDSYDTVEAALRVVNAIETQIKQNSK